MYQYRELIDIYLISYYDIYYYPCLAFLAQPTSEPNSFTNIQLTSQDALYWRLGRQLGLDGDNSGLNLIKRPRH